MPESIFCSRCGSQRIFGTSFCGKCGAKFVDEAEDVSVSPIKSVDSQTQSQPKSKNFNKVIVAGLVLLLLVGLIYVMLPTLVSPSVETARTRNAEGWSVLESGTVERGDRRTIGFEVDEGEEFMVEVKGYFMVAIYRNGELLNVEITNTTDPKYYEKPRTHFAHSFTDLENDVRYSVEIIAEDTSTFELKQIT